MDALRRARPDDAEDIAAVFLASKREALPYLPEVHDESEHAPWIAGQIAMSEVWVAEEEGRVVAMMVLGPSSIDQLYVAPGRQGAGLGGRLVDLAKERRPTGLWLWAFQRNERARAFYEHRGFRPTEFTPGDNEREPDVRYEWRP